MKVLVTGGLGYLGSVLVPTLINKGYDIKVLDNALYGEPLKHICKFYKYDIRYFPKKIINGVDAVIHLAGIVGEKAGNINPFLTYQINSFATERLAKMIGNKKFIFASTSSVYGFSNFFINEKSKVLPLSIYALSKLNAEIDVRDYCKNAVIFRMGTLYGYSPRMRFDLVVNRFIAQALYNGKITVFGGSQYRPFIHVKDVIKFYIEALENDVIGIINLTSDNFSILNLAQLIKFYIKECKINVLKKLQDMRNYRISNEMLLRLFNSKFSYGIGEAINEIKDHFKIQVNINSPIFNNDLTLQLLQKRGIYK